MHTCSWGKIVEFFPETQTATVKLIMDEVTKTADRNYLIADIAELVDVPVQFPSAGGYVLTFPVKKDDPCMVYFTERGYSHWIFEDREHFELIDGRPEEDAMEMFDFSNAVAVMGGKPMSRVTPEFKTDAVELRNESGSQKVSIKADTIDVVSTDNVNLTAGPQTVQMNASGVSVNSTGDINLTATGNLNLTAALINMIKG